MTHILHHIKYFIAELEGTGYEITFEQKTVGSSGYDLHANIGLSRTISPGRRFVIRTGIHVQMDAGIEAHVRPRSGLVRDHGIVCAFGSIDSDYRGEVSVTLFNHGDVDYKVLPGDRIAQLVFSPVFPYCASLPRDALASRFVPERVKSLSEFRASYRGASGYGSTGR